MTLSLMWEITKEVNSKHFEVGITLGVKVPKHPKSLDKKLGVN
jgi:hypothetical protein